MEVYINLLILIVNSDSMDLFWRKICSGMYVPGVLCMLLQCLGERLSTGNNLSS